MPDTLPFHLAASQDHLAAFLDAHGATKVSFHVTPLLAGALLAVGLPGFLILMGVFFARGAEKWTTHTSDIVFWIAGIFAIFALAQLGSWLLALAIDTWPAPRLWDIGRSELLLFGSFGPSLSLLEVNCALGTPETVNLLLSKGVDAGNKAVEIALAFHASDWPYSVFTRLANLSKEADVDLVRLVARLRLLVASMSGREAAKAAKCLYENTGVRSVETLMAACDNIDVDIDLDRCLVSSQIEEMRQAKLITGVWKKWFRMAHFEHVKKR